ncbi:reverse transcriptase [Canna indica]|uniref:Reverse transcriptase n=1 Tax=Canna indica TaxID=4628 RepID=A0AAQ3JPY5_9LILI|nr:reverse transcriptase [Canna indica]
MAGRQGLKSPGDWGDLGDPDSVFSPANPPRPKKLPDPGSTPMRSSKSASTGESRLKPANSKHPDKSINFQGIPMKSPLIASSDIAPGSTARSSMNTSANISLNVPSNFDSMENSNMLQTIRNPLFDPNQLSSKKPNSWAFLFKNTNLIDNLPIRDDITETIDRMKKNSSEEVFVDDGLIQLSRSNWVNSLYGKFYGHLEEHCANNQGRPENESSGNVATGNCINWVTNDDNETTSDKGLHGPWQVVNKRKNVSKKTTNGQGTNKQNRFEVLHNNDENREKNDCNAMQNFSWNRIPHSMHNQLVSNFSEKEVINAINSLRRGKAPGPDGYNLEFYLKYWGNINNSFMAAMNEFHKNNSVAKGEIKAFKYKEISTKEDYLLTCRKSSLIRLLTELRIGQANTSPKLVRFWLKVEEACNIKFKFKDTWSNGTWLDEVNKSDRNSRSLAEVSMIKFTEFSKAEPSKAPFADINQTNQYAGMLVQFRNTDSISPIPDTMATKDIDVNVNHACMIQCDVAWLKENDCAGLGFQISDEYDNVSHSCCSHMTVPDPLSAELWAIWLSMIKAKALNMKHIKIFSDCLRAVNILKKSFKTP